MDKSNILASQIAKLHSKKFPDNVVEKIINQGKPAYDYLFAIIDEPRFTKYQIVNLLRILYMMRYHGNIEALVNKLLSFIQDDRIEVRSTASYLSICLLRMKEAFDYLDIPLEREKLMQLLQNALATELDSVTTQTIKDFLKSEI